MTAAIADPPSRTFTSGLIVGLTTWWLASPLMLSVGSALTDKPQVEWLGVALLWMALGGAGVAPFAGLAVALAAKRRRASVYFALMSAVTLGVLAFLLYALAQA